MAYVYKEYAAEGEIVLVKIRSRFVKAEVAKFPLYDTRRYGFRRES
jgi:glycine cleavage system aminomethyltransferase T